MRYSRFLASTLLLLMASFLVMDCGSKSDPAKLTAYFTYVPSFNGFVTFLNSDFSNSPSYAISYLWTFGDGITSTVTSPYHTFASNGSYTVQLNATGPGGKAEFSQTVTITNVWDISGTWNEVSSKQYSCTDLSLDFSLANCSSKCISIIITKNSVPHQDQYQGGHMTANRSGVIIIESDYILWQNSTGATVVLNSPDYIVQTHPLYQFEVNSNVNTGHWRIDPFIYTYIGPHPFNDNSCNLNSQPCFSQQPSSTGCTIEQYFAKT
jgi:PKD repeat protein